MQLAKESPEKFYEMRVADAQVAAVSVMTRNFDNWQRRIRIKAQTQLMQIIAYIKSLKTTPEAKAQNPS